MHETILKPISSQEIKQTAYDVAEKAKGKKTTPKKSKKKKQKSEVEILVPSIALVPFFKGISGFLENRLGKKWAMNDDEISGFSESGVAVLNKYFPDITKYQEEIAFIFVGLNYVASRRLETKSDAKGNSRSKSADTNDNREKGQRKNYTIEKDS